MWWSSWVLEILIWLLEIWQNNMSKLWEEIREKFPAAKQGVELSRYTTFKIGGPVKFLIPVRSVEELQEALKIAHKAHLDYFVFGGASNMLVADEGYRGIAIKMEMNSHSVVDEMVMADAGMITAALTRATIDAGLTGFEWGIGVPGTIGGAVRGNAGAFGGEMRDVVESVNALIDGEIVELSNKECKFGYRHSIFKENGGIVLGVTLRLKMDEERGGAKKMIEFLKQRNETQPKGSASSGCIFKNFEFEEVKPQWEGVIPDNFLAAKRISAGWLIEHAGLKGTKVGGAQVSDVHGNFTTSDGSATAADVRALIEKIKAGVAEKFGIDLQEEIQYIGF